MYVLKYNDFPEYLKIGEYEVPLPEPPDKKDILNYNLPLKHQKFRRTTYQLRGGKHIEANRLTWPVWDTLSASQQVLIEQQEWDKRNNGVWMYIKDMPVCLTGFHQWMLNYWQISKNVYPDFRENNWAATHLLDYLVHHPKAMGLLWLKGRRMTVTTIVNAYGWNWATTHESQVVGLMNKTERDAYKLNLNRMNLAMNGMPAFFDPLRLQNWPKRVIEFMPPDERTTAKTLRERNTPGLRSSLSQSFTSEPLMSVIQIGATGATTFDGEELGFFSADELGKWKDVNPVEMWEVHMLALFNGGNKAGFGVLFSSVEEISDQQLDRITEVWDEAEPRPDQAFISNNGLARYAEPFHMGYDGKFEGASCIDQWGFSNHDLAIKKREQILAPLIKAKKNRSVANWKRKMPMDVSEMLRPSAERCSFNLEYLTTWHDALRLKILQQPDQAPVRGTLRGHPKSGQITFIPRPDVDTSDEDHPDAQVYVSRMPTQEERNNVIRAHSGFVMPGNRHIFTIGVDTFDHQINPATHGNQLSDGAFVVKRKLWLPDDDKCLDAETGRPPIDPQHEHYLGNGMKSNQIVCRYVFRDADPDAFAEKVFQAAVFWGAMVHIESSKPGRIRAYAKQHGLEQYLYFKDYNSEAGWSGADTVQQAYFDLLAIHVEHYIRAERDPKVIKALMRMERGNMKRHDLGVAIGIAELGSQIFVPQPIVITADKKIRIYKKRYITR